MTYIFSLHQSEWIRWLNCPPLAIPPLFVLVNNCVSSRKDFNLKLFYFSMCGVAHGFSWFLLGVTGFLQVSLWDIFMPILNMEEEKSISVYVCLTLWQVVDLWTAGRVSGIIYGLYGQSRGWEWVTWPQKSAEVLVEERLEPIRACEGGGGAGCQTGSSWSCLKLKLICPTEQRRAPWNQEPWSSCPDQRGLRKVS